MSDSVTYEKIREEVRAIQKGTVKTHSDIAKELGTTPMLVGKAIWTNGAYSEVPWWRVVPIGGLHEYHGGNENTWLLAHVALLLEEGVKLKIEVIP